VVELRVLGTIRGTVSGYFDDLNELVEFAKRWSGQGSVYVTLNPVAPELLARAKNRCINYAKHTTADNDIAHRRWFGIDFDPKRPAGISSTDAEHEAALDRAKACRKQLREEGWPEPMFADSGNGAHLVYAVDLPNEEESTRLIQGCLQALSMRLSDEIVEVDTSTYNASRIWKLYGTLAMKGDSTEDRPHRLTRIIEKPGELLVVTDALLAELACLVPEESETDGPDVELGDIPVELPGRFVHLLDHDSELQAAWEAKRRPPNDQSRSGFDCMLAGMLVFRRFSNEETAGILRQYSHGKGKTATTNYLRRTIAKARSGTRDGEDQEWTTAQLLEHKFPELEWKVDGLLPEEGFVVIAGKRKIGKGWFYMQAANACATGGEFLGRSARRCNVLVYALEDNPRRISRRMKKQGIPTSADIVWCFRWPGWEAVAGRIIEGQFGLCIIDTLSRAFPAMKQNEAEAVTIVLSEIQEFGLSKHVLIIATDHERKSLPGSVHSMDEIVGSQAKTAVADAILQLHSRQGKHDTILSADGRDYEEEVELVVKFDRESACWKVVGSVEEVKQGEARKQVLSAIGGLQKSKDLPTTKNIAEFIKKSLSYVNEILADLAKTEKVLKGEKIGREQPYFLPGTDVSEWYESSNDKDQ
jgi:hypothetical protein